MKFKMLAKWTRRQSVDKFLNWLLLVTAFALAMTDGDGIKKKKQKKTHGRVAQ